MELSDIAEKIANNARLTPQELDFWKTSFRQIQLNTAYVSGLQAGNASVFAKTITADKFVSGQQSMMGFIANFSGGVTNLVSGGTVADGTIQSWSITSGDSLNSFTTSGIYIYPPTPGLYRIIVNSEWASNSAGTQRKTTVAYDGSSQTKTVTPDANQKAYTTIVINDAFITNITGTKGLYVLGVQNSGSSLDFGAEVYFEKIGEWRWIPS